MTGGPAPASGPVTPAARRPHQAGAPIRRAPAATAGTARDTPLRVIRERFVPRLDGLTASHTTGGEEAARRL
ncbi:hypothetical protein ACH3Y9_02135 [Streptomyces sp. WSLK1-5]|uniref:hypothetical protein n=1 Tax=unclassified Streptomyces TaxID=2593676 RepID=UPI0037AC7C9D